MNTSRAINILLVEDGLANQRLAVALLTKWGYSVEVAEDGQQALDRFLEQREFDLILMDLQMPVMDGLEATRAIRQAEQDLGGRIPILAMTARNLPDDRRQCQLAGMDGFLAKPVRQHDFQAAIQKFFPIQSEAPGLDSNQPRLIDWPGAMSNVDNDAEIMNSVVEASLEELPELTQQIIDRLKEDRIDDVQRLAHTIKASARAFCSPLLLEAAFAVEQAAESAGVEATRQKFATLQPLVDRFIKELREHLRDLT